MLPSHIPLIYLLQRKYLCLTTNLFQVASKEFILHCSINYVRTSLVTQKLKRLSTMQETWVPSLGWEDPLEKEMAIHSSILAWKIPWTEEPGRLQSMGSRRVRHNWATSLSLSLPLTMQNIRIWRFIIFILFTLWPWLIYLILLSQIVACL